MDLNTLVNNAFDDTKRSLLDVLPELILCGTIFLMLIARLFRVSSWLNAFWITLAGTAAALFFASQGLGGDPVAHRYLFTGMLVFDSFAIYVRTLLILFALLFAIFTHLSGITEKQYAADFYCLVLGATIGLCLMTTANHLMMVFLAVEMASLPSYVLAAMMRGSRRSSEAALKYAIYGGGTAGVMLYGISLLAGMLNTAHLPTMAAQLSIMYPEMVGPEKMVLALGALMLGVGLAFKLSAFPFHFWCPDVFEGASAEVDAFLSVASKTGAIALLVRVCLGLGVLNSGVATNSHVAQNDPPVWSESGLSESGLSEDVRTENATTVGVASPGLGDDATVFVSTDVGSASVVGSPRTPRNLHMVSAESRAKSPEDPLEGIRTFMAWMVAVVSVASSTFGNLAAYGQSNIKRMLAYSTIAHAGYMMLPIPVMLLTVGAYPELASRAAASIALYLAFYLFMNLGAFAVVAFLRNGIGSEEIDDYAGMIHRSPGVVICFGVILFSLVGIPPMAGFIGKFAIFASLTDGYSVTGSRLLLFILVMGGINTAISLVYYLRVVKVMVMSPEPERGAAFHWSMISSAGLYITLVTLPIILFFLQWSTLDEWTRTAAKCLLGMS